MPSILVVDDVPEILKMLGAALESAGFEVTTALNAPSAIELCAVRHFDAVLCDVNMPEVTGCEVARWIARHSPATRMVMMSGSETSLRRVPLPAKMFTDRQAVPPARIAGSLRAEKTALGGS